VQLCEIQNCAGWDFLASSGAADHDDHAHAASRSFGPCPEKQRGDCSSGAPCAAVTTPNSAEHQRNHNAALLAWPKMRGKPRKVGQRRHARPQSTQSRRLLHPYRRSRSPGIR
jgi:hypothetical protein